MGAYGGVGGGGGGGGGAGMCVCVGGGGGQRYTSKNWLNVISRKNYADLFRHRN